MIKRLSTMIVLLVFMMPIQVHAETGSVEIYVTGDVTSVSYSKVGSVENGLFVLDEAYKKCKVDLNKIETAAQAERVSEKLAQCIKESEEVLVESDGMISISDLEEGAYLFQIKGKKAANPSLIFIPAWNEIEKQMSYDITIIPKYMEEADNPETGWESHAGNYLALLFISFIIIVCLSCHNRFKCGRISVKYS